MSLTSLAKPISLNDAWWTTAHVALYLGKPTARAACVWMKRRGVKRSKADRRLTCRAWIDSAIEAKGARH